MLRITLVTPTFQQAGTIRQTIESVLGQDHPDLEYIVLDAGSKDGTVDILREYEKDPRFKWASEPDKGQSDAINKGLKRATGEIFNWINSDDYLEPGALKRVAHEFWHNPGVDIVSGQTAEFRGEPPKVFNRIRLQLRSSAEYSIPVGVFCQPSTFWRTQMFRSLGGVDVSLKYVMDWDLWVRYLACYGQSNVRRIDDVLAHFRHHDAAKTSTGSSGFYDEAKIVFNNLHRTIHAPEPFLFPEVEKKSGWKMRDFELGRNFSRERYLGAFAERQVRTYRKSDRKHAKIWLKRSFNYIPWITFWRVKMWLRLLT